MDILVIVPSPPYLIFFFVFLCNKTVWKSCLNLLSPILLFLNFQNFNPLSPSILLSLRALVILCLVKQFLFFIWLTNSFLHPILMYFTYLLEHLIIPWLSPHFLSCSFSPLLIPFFLNYHAYSWLIFFYHYLHSFLWWEYLLICLGYPQIYMLKVLRTVTPVQNFLLNLGFYIQLPTSSLLASLVGISKLALPKLNSQSSHLKSVLSTTSLSQGEQIQCSLCLG